MAQDNQEQPMIQVQTVTEINDISDLRQTDMLHDDSFLDLQEQAEQELGNQQSRDLSRKSSFGNNNSQARVSQGNVGGGFFIANLGVKREKYAIQQVSISRNNPFNHMYGDIQENMFAYMLEELDDDVDCLIQRLNEVNRQLDIEIDKINRMIGETGPRHSVKFSQIAIQLKDNLQKRVSETIRQSDRFGDNSSSDMASRTASDMMDSIMSINHQSNRESNRSSRMPETFVSCNNKMSKQFAEELKNQIVKTGNNAESTDESDLYRQIRMETIKVEQNNISEMSVKEKQLRTYQKLEDLKIQLLRLIGDLQETVTYNPFTGAHQTLERNDDGIAAYSSFVGNNVDGMLSVSSHESRCLPKQKKGVGNEKQRMAILLERIAYQLEKLRFILEKNIFPRDMTLRLFDSQEPNEEMLNLNCSTTRKLSIKELNNNRQILLAYKLLLKLNKKIKTKIQTNTYSMLILQLQSKVQLNTRIYQSFNGFFSEHGNLDTPSQKDTKRAILKARNELFNLIKNKEYDAIDLTQHLNQHLMRLAMPKHNSKRPNDIERMLREDVFMSLKIDSMNWSSLLATEDEQSYYEVTLQLFYGDSKPLSDKTMIPLVKNKDKLVNGAISWAFLQIPMQALITSDLALCIEVYKITMKYGDVEPVRILGITRSGSPVKILVGWSTINLTATYILSNVMAGQSFNFTKLRIFEPANAKKDCRITDRFQQINPDAVKMSNCSALITQILSINGNFSFDTDYMKAKRQLKADKSIHVDLHRFYQRGIYSKNPDMQKRFISHVSDSFNFIQLTIGWIKIPNFPETGLIKVEIYLVNNKGILFGENFRSTRNCSSDDIYSVFESETKEITGSMTEFRDTKFLKLPTVEKVSEYKDYNLIYIIKIGTTREGQQTTGNVFRSKISPIEQWYADPTLFSFEPTFLSVMPLFDEEEKILLADGKHTPKLFFYNHAQFMQMVSRAHEHGDRSNLQTYMFDLCQNNEILNVETKLISNSHSNSKVINFIISMQKPNKLTLQSADRMLVKMRKLVADNPVDLLMHHVQILDRTFRILAIEYENYNHGNKTQTESTKIMEDEDRQDVAFEILLLMIDLFYAIFPEYKCLLNTYLEQHFYQPKVFVALTAQIRLIGSVFSQDMSNANRFWLTQTLSYFPILIKILRISFIQHQIQIEKAMKDKIDHLIVDKPVMSVSKRNIIGNNTIFEEDEDELDNSSQTYSANFGGAQSAQLRKSAAINKDPLNGGNADAAAQPDTVDDFLDAQQRNAFLSAQTKIKGSHNTEEIMATHQSEVMGMDDSSDTSENNELFESRSSETNLGSSEASLLGQSMRSEAGQPEFFQTIAQIQMKEDLKQAQILSSQLDKDTREQKRFVRASARISQMTDGAGHTSKHFSILIKNLPENEKMEEEDIQTNVSESVIDIFQGCHQDGLKITMYLRGILLENFHDILKEVSLVCGAKTASTLLSYLYSPFSLKQQFKQTGQIDSGISKYFRDSKNVENPNDVSMTSDESNYNSFVESQNLMNDSSRSSGENVKALDGGNQKIRLMDGFIGSGNFPFGAQIDSSTTELSLNQLRVLSMAKILYERTLQKIPGNSNEAIEETIMKFSHYVNLFGNVPSSDNISNDHLTLRMHVFFFLHNFFFYVFKDECVQVEQEQSENFETSDLAGKPSSRNRGLQNSRMRSLVENPNSYLHKIVDIFMKNLYQLSQDFIMFKEQELRVSKILIKHPYLAEQMGSFTDQCSLVLLTLISHASKRFIQNNFFSKPSILAKMLDNFNTLDEKMIFQKPFNAYIDKQRLDISAQFNQNVSDLIMEKFGREFPELYIPVVNKLIFRYFYLWLNASNASLVESRSQQQTLAASRTTLMMNLANRDEMVFNKARLLENSQRLINKFKRKCLPDIIQFKQKLEERSLLAPTTTAKNQHEVQLVNQRRADQKATLTEIFQRMHEYHLKSNEKQGVEATIQLLLEAALLEFQETNKVSDSSNVLFEMFTKIKYLQMPYKEVKIYINLVNKLLDRISKEHVNLSVNGEAFKAEFVKYITLLEETFHALYHFNQSKAKSNIFVRALYGCKVIELLSKARLYHEIKRFSRQQYSPILEREFEWLTEIAFLDLYSYDILQSQVDCGAMSLGNEKVKTDTLSDEISSIVDSLVKQRCYALALDLNKKVKELYERNYDLERIQKPLKTETYIYERMHQDTRQHYASYFKVEFVGNGHLEEFRNKTFVLRSIANQDKLVIEEELLAEKFDDDLTFIEDKWPSDEDLNHGHKKYCHLVRVKPLTLKEIDEFDLHDMVDRREIIMDNDDNQLLEKIYAMPAKLQNFYIQNFKDKFYYQQSIRIPGVDPVAFDQKIQIFAVKHKFPYIIGMQQILSRQEKIVSAVRQAIKDIKDTDNALSIIKKIVCEQAIDQGNVQALETTLRKTLVTEINGGFKRYLVYFLNEKSLAMKERGELLLKLYVTMEEHFANVKESIELFSQHSTHDSATSMFYSKLTALERMLAEVEKKTHAKRTIREAEETKEVQEIENAMFNSKSSNVFLQRDSLSEMVFENDGNHLNISYLEKANESTINIDRQGNSQNGLASDFVDEQFLDQLRPKGHSILEVSRVSGVRDLEETTMNRMAKSSRRTIPSQK